MCTAAVLTLGCGALATIRRVVRVGTLGACQLAPACLSAMAVRLALEAPPRVQDVLPHLAPDESGFPRLRQGGTCKGYGDVFG